MDYKEALEVIRKNYPHVGFSDTEFETALRVIAPELSEREDERMRKDLIDYLKGNLAPGRNLINFWIAWLEKQKEQKPNIELIQKSWYMEGYHDGKYNNEPKWLIQTGKGGPRYEENPKYGTQQPAEWSEEDETLMDELESYILFDKEFSEEQKKWRLDKLKSLRPQPKVDLDAIAKREYARGKQDGYWEGVMAERENCKTFHYESPSWPPKMPDLPTETTTNECISSITPHWKPSEEQMTALDNFIWAKEPDKKYSKAVISLYQDLKKL